MVTCLVLLEVSRTAMTAAVVRIPPLYLGTPDWPCSLTRLFSYTPACLFAADIKKRIENLIEREFLERDATDRKMYRYLA
jgi:hypothetical protein